MDERSQRMGARIREIRTARNLTLQDVADAIGVTRQQLGRLEAGQRTLRPDTLARVAAALEVPLSALEPESQTLDGLTSLLELLGYVVQPLGSQNPSAHLPGGSDLAATLTTGPITLRLLVRSLPAATAQDLERLSTAVADGAFDRGVLVTEAPLPPSLRLEPALRRITLLETGEIFARLIDLTPYAEALSDRFRQRGEPYVDPTCEEDGAAGGARQLVPLTTYLRDWLSEPGISHRVLLGESGAGKSTACLKLASELAQGYLRAPQRAPIPLLISLWEFQQFQDLKQLLFKDLLPGARGPVPGAHPSATPPTPQALERLLADGRFVLFLDGLDESTVRWDPYALRRHLRTLGSLLECGSRILLTARTQVYDAIPEFIKLLKMDGRRLGPTLREPPPVRIARLQTFDLPRIEAYIRSSGVSRYQEALEKLDRLRLGELAGRPFVLHLLTHNGGLLRRLETSAHGEVDLTTVLDTFVEAWADQEALRSCLPREELLRLLSNLALVMWDRAPAQLGLAALTRELSRLMDAETSPEASLSEVTHAITDFLQRRGHRDSREAADYRFMHQDLLVFLTARAICGKIQREDHQDFSELWIDDQLLPFLRSMLIKQELQPRLEAWLAGDETPEVRANAAFLLGLIGGPGAEAALWRAADADPRSSTGRLEYSVSQTALFALANLETKTATEAVQRLLRDADSSADARLQTYARLLLLTLHYAPRFSSGSRIAARVRSAVERLDRDALGTAAREVVTDAAEEMTFRCAAMRALGYLGDPAHLVTLETVKDSASPRIQRAARAAISMLTAPRVPGATQS